MSRRKVFLFANTLWFLNRFKSSLILDLIESNYDVTLVYLRQGPIKNNDQINIARYPIKKKKFINFFIEQIFNFRNIVRNNRKEKRILLSFTVGPILLSSIPLFDKYKRIATLEGLGRIFTSSNFLFLIIRILVKRYYKFIFFRKYDGLFVLNHMDFGFLIESNMIPLSKAFILPGTGVDSSIYNPKELFIERKKQNLIDSFNNFRDDLSYISYIGRLSAEKGFFRFLAAILYLISEKKYKTLKFRIICPKEDIDKISISLKNYLLKLGIEIKEYIDEPLFYYASSKIVVLPSTYGEGLSRVALEAAFLGIPVAAIHNRGISSLFMDGMIGEVTIEQEPYGISRLIRKICDNYEFYLSQNDDFVFNNLVEKYDNKSSTTKFISILDTLI